VITTNLQKSPSWFQLLLLALILIASRDGARAETSLQTSPTQAHGIETPTQAAASASPAPIELNVALRMSIEQAQEFLNLAPSWLATDYAKANPEWSQQILWRAGRAAWMLSKPSEQLHFADQLAALSLANQATRQTSLANQATRQTTVSANRPIAMAYSLILRSRNRQEIGDYASGVDLVTQAAAILNASQLPEASVLGHMEFCAAYYSSGQSELALRACERGAKLLDQLPAMPSDAKQWSYAQSDRAWLQANIDNYWFISAENMDRGQADLARAERAMALFSALKMPTMVSMMQDNVSAYYLEKGDAKKALALSQAALALERKQGRLMHALSSQMNIARALSKLEMHQQALTTVEQAISDAKTIDYSSGLGDLYELQMDVAEAAGDLPLAIQAARQSMAVNVTEFDQRNASAITEMDARFQAAEQKRELERFAQDRKIRQLELDTSKAENARQAARLSRNSLWLWLVTVSTIGLIVVSVLFWTLWRASKRYADRMRWLADTDGLTQLLNRRAFVEGFTRSLQQLAQESGKGALCIIDIDYFKSINDSYGHPVGDQALKRIAKLMQSMQNVLSAVSPARRDLSSVSPARRDLSAVSPARRDFTPAQLPQLGRLGGEEFAIWLPKVTADAALAFAEQLRKRIADDHQQSDIDRLGFAVTISIGIAAFSAQTHTDVAQWLSAADRALYRAKHLGRNRCELVEDTLSPT
jgi:GGDEF domain-containing protein